MRSKFQMTKTSKSIELLEYVVLLDLKIVKKLLSNFLKSSNVGTNETFFRF